MRSDVGFGAWASGLAVSQAGVNLVHQLLVLDRPLDAHLRNAMLPDGRREITVHRLVAADVAKAGKQQRRQPLAAHEDEQPVGFEGDHAPAPEQLREPESAEERWDLARVVERPDRPVVVCEGHHHALRTRVGALTRDRRTIAVNGADSWPEAAREMQPVDAFLEEGVAARDRFV